MRRFAEVQHSRKGHSGQDAVVSRGLYHALGGGLPVHPPYRRAPGAQPSATTRARTSKSEAGPPHALNAMPFPSTGCSVLPIFQGSLRQQSGRATSRALFSLQCCAILSHAAVRTGNITSAVCVTVLCGMVTLQRTLIRSLERSHWKFTCARGPMAEAEIESDAGKGPCLQSQ